MVTHHSELSDDDMVGDSDDETDPEDEPEDQEERARRMDALVPALPADEWGSRTQAPAPAPEKPSSKAQTVTADRPKRVSFDASAKPDTSGLKAGRIEPLTAAISEYDGMNIDSDDESDEDEDTAPTGWGAQSSESIIGEGAQTKTELAASIKALADEFSRDVSQNGGRAAKSSSVLDKKTRFEEVCEERPAVQEDENMEPEVDMAAEEEDFLRFAREALGIDEDQWNGMLDERKSRGGGCAEGRGKAKLIKCLSQPMSPQPVQRKQLLGTRMRPCHLPTTARRPHPRQRQPARLRRPPQRAKHESHLPPRLVRRQPAANPIPVSTRSTR